MIVILLALVSSCSPPEGAPNRPPDKSAYHLFNPTPRDLMRGMSTDRPDATESPYTVDAGHAQVELSFADYTFDRRHDAGQTRRTLIVLPVLLKLGVLTNVDVQLGLDPYTRERTEDRATGAASTADGFGDLLVRVKINLWGNDGGRTAFGIMPCFKFPTADDALGNDEVEGGLILPFSMALDGEWTLGAMLDLGVVRAGADDRHVWDLGHTVTVSRGLFGDLGGFLEYAGFVSLNADEDYRGYLDTGLTYAISGDVQLDAGVRLGLTRVADDFGVFAGLSLRY